MDFECDIGYARAEGSTGPCLEQESRLSESAKEAAKQELWAEQCDEYGYYEITQGYRKVPGNVCEGGIDLSPARYHCSSGGWIASWFTFRGIFMLGVIGALCYYGWPLIEAVLLLLPVPDPSDMKDKAKEYSGKAMDYVKGLSGDGNPPAPGYQQEFGVPGSL